MPIFNFRFFVPRITNTAILCFLFCVFCLTAAAQEVTVLTNSGNQITGSLLEYKDNILEINTENGTLRIPAEELVQVSFTTNKAQVFGEADKHLWSGKQFLSLGMEDEALEEFKAAMHESPLYARPHSEIGALLNKMGQKKEALQYFSRAIKLDPNLPDITARDFIDVAEAYLDDDKLEDAADTYHLIYKTFPESMAAEIAVYRAGFLFVDELKNDGKALEALEDAIAAFPMNQNVERALYEVGRLRQEAGSPEAAEGVLRQLISEFPSSRWTADAHYIMAKIYLQQRRNEDAIQELEKVLDESPGANLSDKAEQMLDECIWLVYNSSDGLSSNDIRALAQDGDYIWVGTAAGVTLFDLKKKEFASNGLLKEMEIQALAVDDFHLWIGARHSGVRRYNKMDGAWKLYTENERLSSDSVLAISVDTDGVWTGTARSGIYRYDKFSGDWRNYTMSHGLPGDNIFSIESAPSGGLWCGTWEKGVSFFDSSTGRWQSDPGIPNEASVTSIAAGADYIWFAWYGTSSNGVSRYNMSTKSWDLVQEVTTAAVDEVIGMINLAANDSEAWVGTETEVLLYDYATLQWYPRPFNYPPELSGKVTTCVLIGDDAVWFATPRGLGRLDKKLLRRVNHIRRIMGKDNGNY
ncbi:tetratricopeptide repeat protein [Candidatus Poribacteria bacterium]